MSHDVSKITAQGLAEDYSRHLPDSERWLADAQVQHEVEEAIAWAERHPPCPTDLEALAARLTP